MVSTEQYLVDGHHRLSGFNLVIEILLVSTISMLARPSKAAFMFQSRNRDTFGFYKDI